MKKTTKKTKEPRIWQLGNGDFVKVRDVSPLMLDQVMAAVEDPPVPVAKVDVGEGKTEDFQNPNDPEYLRDLAKAEADRQRRSVHAVIVHGMTLVDEEGNPIDPPDPSEDPWEFRLKFNGVNWRKEIEKISGELESEEEVKFARMIAYIMFAAMNTDDMGRAMTLAGASEEDQRKAAAQFQRQET